MMNANYAKDYDKKLVINQVEFLNVSKNKYNIIIMGPIINKIKRIKKNRIEIFKNKKNNKKNNDCQMMDIDDDSEKMQID